LTGDDPEQPRLIGPVSPLNGFVNKHVIRLYPADKLHLRLQGALIII
jgi:hypothetical protein